MKLKKILSVVLSGALAVVMLAGCGGGTINKFLNDRSGDVRSALNGEYKELTFQKGGRELADAVSTVAGTLVDGQVVNGHVTGNVSNAVEQLTGYKAMPLTKWNPLTGAQENDFVAVFTYNVDSSEFDTAQEIGKDIADTLAALDLANAKDDHNSYTGYVSAYETRIGSGDDAYHAWVVGVHINQKVTE